MVLAEIQRALADLLRGDVAAIAALAPFSNAEIADAGDAMRLELSAAAVVRVLTEHEQGLIADADAQRWAEFMRHGYLRQQHAGPIRELEIDFDAQAEDAIVEALARLDELGDLIDGELRPGEAAELRAALLAAQPPRQ
jgi:hypothetical protein